MPKKPFDIPAIVWADVETQIPEPVRFELLKAADYRCTVCRAEMGRTIWRRYTQWFGDPRLWVEYDGTTATNQPWDAFTVTVHLAFWAPTWPCEPPDLRVLCGGCLVRAVVATATPVRHPTGHRRPYTFDYTLLDLFTVEG